MYICYEVNFCEIAQIMFNYAPIFSNSAANSSILLTVLLESLSEVTLGLIPHYKVKRITIIGILHTFEHCLCLHHHRLYN